jgi:orotate phosphoribosyltransferase
MTKHNKASQFYDAIDQMTSGGSTLMDAIVEYCENLGLEIEAVVPLVNRNSNMVSRLRMEAEAVNAIEKVSHLPL